MFSTSFDESSKTIANAFAESSKTTSEVIAQAAMTLGRLCQCLVFLFVAKYIVSVSPALPKYLAWMLQVIPPIGPFMPSIITSVSAFLSSIVEKVQPFHRCSKTANLPLIHYFSLCRYSSASSSGPALSSRAVFMAASRRVQLLQALRRQGRPLRRRVPTDRADWSPSRAI